MESSVIMSVCRRAARCSRMSSLCPNRVSLIRQIAISGLVSTFLLQKDEVL